MTRRGEPPHPPREHEEDDERRRIEALKALPFCNPEDTKVAFSVAFSRLSGRLDHRIYRQALESRLRPTMDLVDRCEGKGVCAWPRWDRGGRWPDLHVVPFACALCEATDHYGYGAARLFDGKREMGELCRQCIVDGPTRATTCAETCAASLRARADELAGRGPSTSERWSYSIARVRARADRVDALARRLREGPIVHWPSEEELNIATRAAEENSLDIIDNHDSEIANLAMEES